jgi:hypothetical protein
MAQRILIAALSMILAAPVTAASLQPAPATGAPPGGPLTRYCMHVDPITGSNVQTIQCWTREEWAEQDVDVDREWAKNGVRVEG